MNTEDKRLALAELIHGRIIPTFHAPYHRLDDYSGFDMKSFDPYIEDERGLAQFATIFLSNNDVMEAWARGGNHWCTAYEPTQSNILDEILRMNDIDIEN